MSDAIQQAIAAMEIARSTVGPFNMVVTRKLTESIDALQALQHSGEPVVFTCHGNNAPAYGCNKPGDMSGTYYKAPQPATTKPIAAVKGWFRGECVVQALDPSLALPAGMALYAAPQPVVPEGYRVERGSVTYNEILVTAPDGGQQIFWPDDAAYELIKDLLSAGKENNNAL